MATPAPGTVLNEQQVVLGVDGRGHNGHDRRGAFRSERSGVQDMPIRFAARRHIKELTAVRHPLRHHVSGLAGGGVHVRDARQFSAGIANAEQAIAEGFVSLDNGLGTVDLSQLPGELSEGLNGLRLFRGYAGWGPGQLDAELDEGAWLVLPAEPDDVFCAHPQGLWRNVLRRSGGRTSLLADAPDDLSWN